MTRLLIGNCFTEELAGDPELLPEARLRALGDTGQLVLWFAQDGDIVVLPKKPDEPFARYLTTMTGTDLESLRLVVPPPGNVGSDLLTPDRLADPELRETLRTAIGGETVETVFALTPDTAVVSLARALGFESAVPGHAFLGQGGGALMNSKAGFRAIAAGAGVPLPEGTVCTNTQSAESAIAELFAQGHPVMLKQDFMTGGRGNEIVSPQGGFEPVGAANLLVLHGRAAIRSYLAERWEWLTASGRFPVVVERYFPGSRAVFAEFEITDTAAEFAEQGEMLSAPTANSQIIPSPDLAPSALARLVSFGARLCESLRALGYRGRLSADAIVTPDGEVLFTEHNGRITGSTHVYSILGRHIVGADYADARVILEIWRWVVPSLAAAVAALNASGLAYDRGTRTGVVILKASSSGASAVRYCVIAHDLDEARRIHAEVSGLFAAAAV